MINKDVQYGKAENVTLAEFGTGDIMMVVGSDSIGFKTTEPRKINIDYPHDYNGKTLDVINPEIVFRFTKAESIDALIYQLNEVKKQLINSDEPKDASQKEGDDGTI